MAKPVQQRRLVGMALVLLLALGGLIWRLVDLQVLRHKEFRSLAERNTHRAFVRQPMRGNILDTRGNLLATSAPAKTVVADPGLIGPYYPQVAHILAPLLEVDEAQLSDRLMPRIRENGTTNRYVVLKRRVPLDRWEEIRGALSRLPPPAAPETMSRAHRIFWRNLQDRSVYSEEDRLRVYPNETLAAHVLGYMDFDGQGVRGIEKVFDDKLRGVPGWRRTELDSRRREVVPFRRQDVEPRNGMNVILTIDTGLQHILETELLEAMERHDPVSVTGIIVRPRTGEILAMATLPTYDPANPGVSPMEALKNRAVEDIAEPGSTFKIVVVSGALNERVVSLDDTFDCMQGRFSYGGRILHDVGRHGVLSVKSIITKSSNIGTAQIGIRMGDALLHQYIRDFGFGLRTGVPLPGEVSGIVHPVRSWSRISIAQIPMGHGIAVTPLQMTLAMSAIANDGRLMRPMLIKRIEDPDGNPVVEFHPQVVRQAVSEMAARQMVDALKTVTGSEGTGQRARLEHYTVAGKTGTAQKAGPGGYMPGKYYSSFIGFFPADYPELCVSIFLDEPKNSTYGGQTAAPSFKRVAEQSARYLSLRPEGPAETSETGIAAAVLQRNF